MESGRHKMSIVVYYCCLCVILVGYSADKCNVCNWIKRILESINRTYQDTPSNSGWTRTAGSSQLGLWAEFTMRRKNTECHFSPQTHFVILGFFFVPCRFRTITVRLDVLTTSGKRDLVLSERHTQPQPESPNWRLTTDFECRTERAVVAYRMQAWLVWSNLHQEIPIGDLGAWSVESIQFDWVVTMGDCGTYWITRA